MDAMTDGRHIPTSDLLAETGWMHALARSLVHDDALAEDVVQESLVRAIERPPRELAGLRGWLSTVVRRLASRARAEGRARRRREEGAARTERSETTPLDVIERVELHGKVVELVLALEEPFRSALLLHYFDEQSPGEIAQRQGVDVTTVRWRIRKGLDRLRVRLDRVHGGRAAWLATFAPLLLPGRAAEASAAALGPAPGGAPALAHGMSSSRLVLYGVTVMKAKSLAMALVFSLILSLGIGLGIVLPLLRQHSETPARLPEPVAAPAPAAAPTPRAVAEQIPSAAPPAEAPTAAVAEAGAIVGVVKDRDTGEPLPGAIIRVRDGAAQAVAGEGGAYRLAIDATKLVGEKYLVASAEAHAEEHARARIEEVGEFVQDFQLEAAVELRVTVVRQDGTPLEGVQVTACQPNGGYVYDEHYSRNTDRDGKAVLAGIGRKRQQQVNARKDGFREVWTKDYEIDPDRDWTELRIVMEPRLEGDAVVTGRVTGSDGVPLFGVHVQWIHSHGEKKGRVVTETDRGGEYRLVFPRDQDWCAVGASAQGFAASIREGVRPGNAAEPARVDFTLSPGHWLEGDVVDEKGQPVEGVQIRALPTIWLLRNTSVHPGNAREAVTDKLGRFSLSDVSAPRVALRLDGPPGVEWAHNYHPEVEVDRRVRLELVRWGVFRGRVSDRESGEAVPVFTIKLRRGAGYYDYRRADPGEVFNSAEGLFALTKLDPGEIEFTVESEGYIPKRVREAPVEAEDRASLHELRITKGRFIEGLVVDAASGAALAGARVVFGAWEKKDYAWDEGSLGSMIDRQELTTGADGAFRAREGEPGTLFVLHPGYARVVMGPDALRAALGASQRLVIALEPGCILTGTMYQDGKPSKDGFLVLYRRKGGDAGAVQEWIGNLDRDAAGRFRGESLEPGDYLLEHWRETPGKRTAGLSIQRSLRLEIGRDTVVEFGADLGALSFAGRCVGSDGKPEDRTRLTLRPEFAWEYTEFAATVTAEHEGRFHFLGLRPGRYRLEAKLADGTRERLPLLELGSDLEQDILLQGTGEKPAEGEAESR